MCVFCTELSMQEKENVGNVFLDGVLKWFLECSIADDMWLICIILFRY